MTRSLGGLGDLFGSSTDIDWHGDPEDLLYEGERIENRVDFGEGEIVVTSHRLLVFAPESSASQFETVDRPNVVGLDLGYDGDASLLERAIKWAFGGVALVVASQFVDLSGLIGDVDLSSAAGIGMGGLFGMLTKLLNLLTRIDELMRIVGALAVILAMVMLAAYMLTRSRVLAIELAGRDDVQIPAPQGFDYDTVERVQAVLTGPEPDAGGRGSGPAGGPSGGAGPASGHGGDRPHDPRASRHHDRAGGHGGDTDDRQRPPRERRSDETGDRGFDASNPDPDDGSFKSDDPLGPSDGSGGGT